MSAPTKSTRRGGNGSYAAALPPALAAATADLQEADLPDAAPCPPAESAPPAACRRHEEAGEQLTLSFPAPREWEGYASSRLDLRLTPRQATTLKRFWLELRSRHCQQASGRHVDNGPDAIRWLLDQIAELLAP